MGAEHVRSLRLIGRLSSSVLTLTSGPYGSLRDNGGAFPRILRQTHHITQMR
jgi:hypothetical protein